MRTPTPWLPYLVTGKTPCSSFYHTVQVRMVVALNILVHRNEDSASEDGSEPPSPRQAPVVQNVSDTADGDVVMANADTSKEASEEEDPMVSSVLSARLSQMMLSPCYALSLITVT